MFTNPFEAAILIVDDQPSNVRLLEHTLRLGGYVAATSTTNPSEVCALHRRNRYDLIILDLQMPVMSGFEVMQALSECEEHGLPVILVMSAAPTQLPAALAAGATSFLGKPFVLADLLAAVKRLLLDVAARTLIEDVAPVAA